MTDISVIIPSYGSPIFLSKAIESVLNQSYSNLELIIVDDNNPGSLAREQTEAIVSSYSGRDDRIQYVKHDYNKNGAAARNTGFAIANGEFIALLDSDDEYVPDRLQRCYEAMQGAPKEVAGVYTGCEFRRGGRTFSRFKGVQSGSFLKETLACKFRICTGSNIFVKKTVIDELNGFDQSFLRQQDYEFLVRVFERYSLIAIPEVLVIKNNENINLPNVDKLIEIRKQYLGKYQEIIDTLPKESQNYIYHWNCISIAEAAMARNNKSLANQYYEKAQSFGSLSLITRLRRLAFPIYNLIK